MGSQQVVKMPDEKEVLGLTEAIPELSVEERKVRTSLWAALQITIDDATTNINTGASAKINLPFDGKIDYAANADNKKSE